MNTSRYGEGYPNSFTSDVEWMDLMTDDVEISTGAVPENTNGAEGDDTNNLPAGRGAFCWAYDIEYYLTNYGDAYLNRYENIRDCNIVIEAGESMMGDKDTPVWPRPTHCVPLTICVWLTGMVCRIARQRLPTISA